MSRFLTAYAAGLFDGEGCVNLRIDKGKKSCRLTAAVAMTDDRPLHLLSVLYGGTVNKHIRNDQPANWKPQYSWNLYGEKAVAFLSDILEYSIVKRLHIQVALDLYKDRAALSEREHKVYFEIMKLLNSKGPDRKADIAKVEKLYGL